MRFKTYHFMAFICCLLLVHPASAAGETTPHQLLPELKIDTALSSPLSLPTIFPLKNIKAPLRLLIDVRSNHSDGAHDFTTLIDLAEARHIEALAFTEHDRYTIRLGIDPVPYLFGYSQEHPSLYQTGLAQFFADLDRAQSSTSLTLFAGTESIPGYYWQGIPFKDLSLHSAERHLITIGAKTAAQIQGLTSYDLRHAYGSRELSLIFWAVFMLLIIFIGRKRRRLTQFIVGSLLVTIALWLLKPEDNADREFIASAREQGLFVIWTHPGTLSGVREGPMGVQLNTPPYSELVFANSTADAFAAVYGDSDENTIAGGLWDQYMMDYIHGLRAKPIWAVAAGDYHQEGQANEYLGNFPMDVWAESAGADDIILALKQGRMSSWSMQKEQNIATRALLLAYSDNKKQLLPGGQAVVSSTVQAVVALHDLAASAKAMVLQGQWIVDGSIRAKVKLSTANSDFAEATPLTLSPGRHVIRFQIPPQQGVRMESNPFLVQVEK